MKRQAKAGLILVGVLAATAPAYARNGADDGAGTDGTAGSAGYYGSTSGTAGTAGTAGTDGTAGTSGSDDLFHAPGRHSRQLDAAVAGCQGHLERVYRPKRNREDISVEVSLRLGNRVKGKAAKNAVIAAEFPDGSFCELEFDRIEKRRAYYELHVKSKNGVYTQVHGDCDESAIPSIASGGTVTVVHDEDDDRSTPGTVLLQRHF